MQGQRGIIGTLSETLDFDHVPTPANAIIGQQIFWSSVRNSGEDRMADFINLNETIGNPVGQEHQSLGGWDLGESSSSRGQIEVNHDEQKLEHLWSSSTISSAENGLRLEDNVNLNHQIIRSHNPDLVPQNFNLNTSFVDHGHNSFQVTEDPNGFKISGIDNERSSSGVPNPPLVPSRTSRLVLGDNGERPGCSLDSRRTPCKRKAIEGNIGQSSLSGSSSFFQNPEAPWLHVPRLYDAGSSLSIPVASPSTVPRLDLGSRGGSSGSNFDSPLTAQPEGSHRNLRLRINLSNQESAPATLFSNGSAVRHSVVQHPHHSSRLLAPNHSVEITRNQVQPLVMPVPALPQSGQSLGWNESSSARTGSSLTPVSLADREDANPRSSTRTSLEHQFPLHLNDLRNLARSSISRNLTAGAVSAAPGNAASSSRSGSSSGSHPLAPRSWVPPSNVSSRSSRRLADYVRRSLLTSTVPGSGGQGDLHPTMHMRPSVSSASSSEEPSAASTPVRHRSHPGSAAWMDRQGERAHGIPYPLRTLTVGGEGRSRSEQIRNVLDLMRRGEGLRLEDVMILDQSLFFGVADMHDRHRDMRLDVDNMSYEELLALEERIGNVNTGLTEETIMKLLKQREYSVALRFEVEAEPCCVCQEEYNHGENLGTLDCGHNFHTDCIKQWLMLKNWCPICKTTGLSAS